MLRVAELAGMPVNVAWVLSGILLALVAGSVVRILRLSLSQPSRDVVRSRLGSLITWWCSYLLLASVAILGVGAGAVVFAVLSLVALGEYRGLARTRISGTATWWWIYAVVPIHYLLIYLGWFEPFWTFIPVGVLLATLGSLAVRGRTKGFLETVGILFLGLMLVVFLFSHAALVLSLPASLNPVAGVEGLFVYLIVLTELNDIAQALAGRRFGSRRIAPKVSPHKTWAGFMGGMVTTLLIAVPLAPLLTPLRDAPPALEQIGVRVPYLAAVIVGLLVAVGGFLGDIAMSAIKREVGVKDSGDMLPGQGGLLDRIDSLIFTAPLFFYFTYVFYN